MKQSIFFTKQKLFPIPHLLNKFLISRLFNYHLDSQYGLKSAMKGAGGISGNPGTAQINLKMKFYYANGSLGVIIIL